MPPTDVHVAASVAACDVSLYKAILLRSAPRRPLQPWHGQTRADRRTTTSRNRRISRPDSIPDARVVFASTPPFFVAAYSRRGTTALRRRSLSVASMPDIQLTSTDARRPSSPSPGSPRRSCPFRVKVSIPQTLIPSSIAITYLCCIIAGSGYTAMLPAIIHSTNASLAEISQLTAAVAIASAAGKFLYGGWLVDIVGVNYAMVLSLFATAACALATSIAPSFSVILPLACAADFFFCPFWPAHVQWVRSSTRFADNVSSGIWQLSVASRTGAVASQLLYGWACQLASWRAAEAASAMIPITIIAIRGYHALRARSEERSGLVAAAAAAADSGHQAAPELSSSSKPLPVRGMLRKMACEYQFWLAAFGNGFLGAVKSTGAIFVGVYLRDDCAPGGVPLADSLSMQLAASFNAGIGLSVLGPLISEGLNAWPHSAFWLLDVSMPLTTTHNHGSMSRIGSPRRVLLVR